MAMHENILTSFRKQYESMWKMLDDGIRKTNDTIWKQNVDISFFVPARLLLHIVETIDYYFDSNPKEFVWNTLCDWENVEDTGLESKEELRSYEEKVKEKVYQWFEAKEAADLNAPEHTFHTDWATDLERAIYVLRHTQHHLGQLSHDLQRRGYEEINWD